MLFYKDADPTIIVFQPEVEQVRASTWVNDVRGWSSVNELMQHFFNAMERVIFVKRLLVLIRTLLPDLRYLGSESSIPRSTWSRTTRS